MAETILEAELEEVSLVLDNCFMKEIISTNVEILLGHRMGCFSVYDTLSAFGRVSEFTLGHNMEDIHRKRRQEF